LSEKKPKKTQIPLLKLAAIAPSTTPSLITAQPIAQCLDLPLEIVREEAQKHQNSSS